jgi:serine/threonine-protein kinase
MQSNPSRLGPYEIRQCLGRSVDGAEYEGFDPATSQRVLVKAVRLDCPAASAGLSELDCLHREIECARARLDHPSLVAALAHGETEDVAYAVSEWVDGIRLKRFFQDNEKLSLAAVLQVMDDLLACLTYLHDHGMIHGDIRPACIILTPTGRAKIALGPPCGEDSRIAAWGEVLGSYPYMSPEQHLELQLRLEGRDQAPRTDGVGQTVDARTDIYSAGALFYFMLTGEPPFAGNLGTITNKVLNATPVAPSEISARAPEVLDPVVRRAMARWPRDRYPTAAAFKEAIAAALAEGAASLDVARPTRARSSLGALRRWLKRHAANPNR